MAKKKLTPKEEYNRGLRRLALGDAKDAVRLLFMDDETVMKKIGRMDLINISEIKRPKTGGMEIKLFDRLKALEKLNELESEGQKDSLGFYRALEQSAADIGDNLQGDECE